MIIKSDSYKNAIVGDSRKIKIKAEIKFVDPDITYLETTFNSNSIYSKPNQIYDDKFNIDKLYASLENGLWPLNGSADIYPDDPSDLTDEVGYQSGYISDDLMSFSSPVVLKQYLGNVSLLKVFSLLFPGGLYGVASDFYVNVYGSDGSIQYTKSIVGNTKNKVDFSGLSVENASAIELSVSKWSISNRRARVVEIIVGLYDVFTDDEISFLSVQQQVDFTCMTIPYGYCNISIDNQDKRFSSENKDGLFEILEERQPMKISLGVLDKNGSFDYTPIGTYYMYNGGWKENSNQTIIDWYLVDIIGLLSSRPFKIPEVLPTTLEGWVKEVIGQIGMNFLDKYEIKSGYESTEVKVINSEYLNDKTCGEILKNACMVSACYPRASNVTGNLKIEPPLESGNSLTLDNVETYPVAIANKDCSQIEVKIYPSFPDVLRGYYDGTNPLSTEMVTIDNFFVRGGEEPKNVADYVVQFLGGNTIEITGRGDMSSECGDTDDIEFSKGNYRKGIRKSQEFTFNDYVLKSNKSSFIEVK